MSEEFRRNAGSSSKTNSKNTTAAVLDLPDHPNARPATQHAAHKPEQSLNLDSAEIARLAGRVGWLEAVLDAIPFPIHAIDLDMKWAFLNKAFEKLMLDNQCIASRAEAVGKPCSTAKANICNTDKCGIRQLVNTGLSISHFDWHGTDCKQDTAKILSPDGKHIGWVELVQDLTTTVRVKDYTNHEVTRLASNLVQIAKGNIQVDLTVAAGDEYTKEAKAQFETISESMQQLRESISAMVADATMLAASGAAGKLDIRADASRHHGVFAELMQHTNEMLDAILLPIGEGNRILAQISEGKIDELITEQYKGDHEKMKIAVNNVAAVIQKLRDELGRLIYASHNGMLSERGKAEQFKGAFADLMKGVNEMLDAILLPIGEGNRILALISEGKIDELITEQYKGDHEKMKIAVNNVGLVVQKLRGELGRLIQASREGELSERGKAEQFKGAFADLMKGVNEMLDAILLPIGEGNRILAQISDGKIDELITEQYKGDHEKMKIAVNNVGLVVQKLRGELGRLIQASQDGMLSERGKAEQFKGAFADLMKGVNEMLDAIIQPLQVSAEYVEQISAGNIPAKITDTYNGDFNKIKNNLNRCVDSVHALVADAAMLAQAGVEGKLTTRADASKHQGDFRKIVDGVNHTLDAVVGPIQEVDKVVGLMAKGDLTQRIEREYAGDFNQLKSAVNTLSLQFGEAIRQIGKETTSLVASSAQLNQVSQQMGASADETSTQANVVSAAAEEVSKNVQTVATGADEMGASIKEIAKSTAEATRVANMAVKTAGTTNQTITKLGQSSAEIGQVIKVITSIAQQTNLLALNATIEAARAGEAGKGFAVVANEVKELAKETAKATEDISQKIEAIQSDTKGAVSAIGEISGVIAQISDIQNTIASAIEEQSATTNEIIRNLAEAAKGSTDISRNIGGVAEAAHTTSAGASETQQSAKSLEKMSAELEVLVSRFKV